MKQIADSVPANIALSRREREFAVAIPGPVDDEGLASQIGQIDELPETAVVAFIAVVTHHEKAVGWNNDGTQVVSGAYTGGKDSAVAVNNVRLRKRLVVYKHLFILDSNGVSGQPNHPLNEIFRGVHRITEHDNVLSFGLTDGNELLVPVGKPDAVDELIDQDMVSNQQGGLHGTRRNFECLDDKSPNHQGQQESNDDGFSIITNDAFGFAFGDAFLCCKLQSLLLFGEDSAGQPPVHLL
jgi:hypothetical protein